MPWAGSWPITVSRSLCSRFRIRRCRTGSTTGSTSSRRPIATAESSIPSHRQRDATRMLIGLSAWPY
jgi:hypothetical protein